MIEADDAHAVERSIIAVRCGNGFRHGRRFFAAIPTWAEPVGPLSSLPRDGGDVRGGTPAIQNWHAAHGNARAVDDERHRRLFRRTEVGVIYRHHETAALHMLVIGKAKRCIHGNARDALPLQQVSELLHCVFAREGFDSGIDLIGMRAAIQVIDPIRCVHLRWVVFPNFKEQFPMLPGYVEINEAVTTWKNSRRSHLSMLAACALHNLLVVGVEANDVLVGRQGFLHRCVNMIALPRALSLVKRREHARGGKQTREIVRLSFRRSNRR